MATCILFLIIDKIKYEKIGRYQRFGCRYLFAFVILLYYYLLYEGRLPTFFGPTHQYQSCGYVFYFIRKLYHFLHNYCFLSFIHTEKQKEPRWNRIVNRLKKFENLHLFRSRLKSFIKQSIHLSAFILPPVRRYAKYSYSRINRRSSAHLSIIIIEKFKPKL